MSAAWLRAAVLLAFLLVGTAPASAAPEPLLLDGIAYHAVAGTSGSMVVVTDTGETRLPFVGCSYTIARPDTGSATVRVVGLLADRTLVEVETERSDTVAATTRARFPGEPERAADLLVEGLGILRIGGTTYADPVGGSNRTSLAFHTSPERVRGEDGVLLPEPERGRQTHLRLGTGDGPGAKPATFTLASRNEAAGLLLPGPHADRLVFTNVAFGGEARLRIRTEANGLPESTLLTFLVRAPDGREVANETLSPSLNAPRSADVAFQLDQFGDYAIVVTGRASLAKYEVAATLQPPKEFDLRFWWDETVFGPQAAEAYRGCQSVRESVVGAPLTIARLDPPAWQMEAVVLGVAATAAAVTLAVALIAYTRHVRSVKSLVQG